MLRKKNGTISPIQAFGTALVTICTLPYWFLFLYTVSWPPIPCPLTFLYCSPTSDQLDQALALPLSTKLGPWHMVWWVWCEGQSPAQGPKLYPIEHLWVEVEQWLRPRYSCPSSLPDLTNLVCQWEFVEVSRVEFHSNTHSFGTGFPTSSYTVGVLGRCAQTFGL